MSAASTIRRLGRIPVTAANRVAIFLVGRKLKRRPNDLALLVTMASLYEVEQRWDLALETIARAQAISPENPTLARVEARIRRRATEAESRDS